jgi:hypothetical protein
MSRLLSYCCKKIEENLFMGELWANANTFYALLYKNIFLDARVEILLYVDI